MWKNTTLLPMGSPGNERWCDIRKSIYIIQFLAISGKVEDTHTYDPEILLSVIDFREFQTYEQQK